MPNALETSKLQKSGFYCEVTDETILTQVDKYVNCMMTKYPDSSKDNQKIGKLGEVAVYSIIQHLHRFSLERSEYKETCEELDKKSIEQVGQEAHLKLKEELKVPSFMHDLISKVDFNIYPTGGDGGSDFCIEYAKGYKTQVKTTRLLRNRSCDSITWKIKNKEITTNKCFIFVICLNDWKPYLDDGKSNNAFLFAGFLSNTYLTKLLTEEIRTEDAISISLNNLLYPAGCVEFLDWLETLWFKEGKHLGHCKSQKSLEFSSLARLTLEEDYKEAEEKLTQLLNKTINTRRTLFNLHTLPYTTYCYAQRAKARIEQAKYPDALEDLKLVTESITSYLENYGDTQVNVFTKNGSRQILLSEWLLALIETKIICYGTLNQWDNVSLCLEEGIERTKSPQEFYEKLVGYYCNLAILSARKKDRDNINKYSDLALSKLKIYPNDRLFSVRFFTPEKFNIETSGNVQDLVELLYSLE